MRIITLPGEKGRIGKITTTINLGVALVEMGRRVLLLDTAPQAVCSRSVGVVVSDPFCSPYTALLSQTSLTELIVRCPSGKTSASPSALLRTGSVEPLRTGPAARRCPHCAQGTTLFPGARSPPYTDNADMRARRRPHLRRQPRSAGSGDPSGYHVRTNLS